MNPAFPISGILTPISSPPEIPHRNVLMSEIELCGRGDAAIL